MATDASRMAAWCSLGLLLLCLRAPHAHAAEPMRVLVRVASAGDRALLPRLFGQLSDVNVRLITLETGPLEATYALQLEAAGALAREHAADVVLWYVAERAASGSTLSLHVVTPADERVLTRQLVAASGAGEEKLASSLLETAALATRSVLVALSTGSHVGTPMPTEAPEPSSQDAPEHDEPAAEATAAPEVAVVAAPQPTAASGQPPVRPSLPPPQLAAAASRSEVAVTEERDEGEPASDSEPEAPLTLDIPMFIGLQGTLDGRSSVGQRGLYVRAGVGVRALVLSVYGAASLASTIDDAYFDLRVARHALGLALELRTQLGRASHVGVGVQGGAALFQRSSRPKSSDVVSTPSSLTAALAFGPELAWRWLSGHYGLGLRLGLDILPNAPSFESGPRPGAAAISHSLWAFQPRLALGLEAALP